MSFLEKKKNLFLGKWALRARKWHVLIIRDLHHVFFKDFA